jgi:hypothetical protein
MAEIFDQLCSERGGYPPTATDFVDRCRAACESEYPEYLQPDRWPGIEARLRRAHPSFVRERHLAALLTEAGVPCARSTSLDIEHGTDLLIAHGPYAIHLATFVASPSAQAHWQRKQRGLPPDAIFVGMPLDAAHCRRAGSYWLYTDEHVRQLLARLPSCVTAGPGVYLVRPLGGQ